MKRAILIALSLVFAVSTVQAQGTSTTPPAKLDEKKADLPKVEDKRTPEQKKYDELMKNPALKSQDGVFKVHRVDDKVYFEIPENKLGRIFLWQAEIAELPRALGFPGTPAGIKTIRFVRKDKKIQMKDLDVSTRTTGDDKSTKYGVELNTVEPVIMAYDIYAEGPNKSVVIDMTSFYNSDPQDFSVRAAIPGAMAVDSSKTSIDHVKAFPNNIEVRTLMTFMMGRGGGGGNPFSGGGASGYSASRASTIVHYSLVQLPEEPMMGRLKDSRIGFFTTGFTVFGSDERRAVPVEYINRYRLEKKDPNAAVSEPVKPIVYYVGREVPDKYKESVRLAIEDWRPAFEQAGFKNAIIGKLAPTKEEDPEWDPEDARYSVIRWAPSEVANAMGPSIQDPRSGETISAHVIVWNNVVDLVEQWYFAQCGATDPAMKHLPISDELMGKLIRYVVAHEVGHTLGLEHNFKGSAAYSVAQLRNPDFTDKYGVASSIMSYSRYNYITQPGDGVRNRIGMVGPYDKFAIQYGYMPITAATPDQEMPTLDALLGKQVTNPWLRFGNYKYSGVDPQMQSEIIGNDPVEGTRLGLLNLERVAKDVLLPATSKYGKSYERTQEIYGSLVNQYITELMHVQQLVGGVIEHDDHVGRGSGQIFQPVPAAQQAKAVNLLMMKGARPPMPVLNPAVIGKIQPTGYADSMNSVQSIVVRGLLSDRKVKALQDFEAMYPGQAYTVSMLVNEVVGDTFLELSRPKVTTSIFERNLHRNFLKMVDGRVNGSGASQTDLRPIMKDALRGLLAKMPSAISRSGDKITKSHLMDCKSDLEKILTDTYAKAGGAAPQMSLRDLLGIPLNYDDRKENCWSWHVPTEIIEILKESKDK
jgi:hypothetical protein